MKCYLCDGEATSVEHSPAKSFFPSDIRVNLITVPSCSLHNEDTSADDEYVRNIISMSLGNNSTGVSHFTDKGTRSLSRSIGLMKATTGKNKRVYYTEPDSEELKPSYAFQIDRLCFDRVMRKTAYGIFHYKYGQTWNRELIVGTEYLRTEGLQADQIGELLSQAKEYHHLVKFEGTNPDVFQFSFQRTESDDVRDQILIMKYYGGFEVWVMPRLETYAPKLDEERVAE